MKTRRIPLSQIVTTAGTQIRASIDEATVGQYADAMAALESFPPVVLFHDGDQYLLADGFHRVLAASRNGLPDIEAELRHGTRADALRFALSANAAHGLRRTNADKRRSVELALAEWPQLSDREIASICAVGKTMVLELRPQVVEKTTLEADTRLGKDGKQYPVRAKKPEANAVKSAPAPDGPGNIEEQQAGEGNASPAPNQEQTDEDRRKAIEAEEAAQLQAEKEQAVRKTKAEALLSLKAWWGWTSDLDRRKFIDWLKERGEI